MFNHCIPLLNVRSGSFLMVNGWPSCHRRSQGLAASRSHGKAERWGRLSLQRVQFATPRRIQGFGVGKGLMGLVMVRPINHLRIHGIRGWEGVRSNCHLKIHGIQNAVPNPTNPTNQWGFLHQRDFFHPPWWFSQTSSCLLEYMIDPYQPWSVARNHYHPCVVGRFLSWLLPLTSRGLIEQLKMFACGHKCAAGWLGTSRCSLRTKHVL